MLLGNPPLEIVGDGSEDDPYIIDDIYELQAINGALPGEAVAELTMRLDRTSMAVQTLAATLFGTESARLGAHYRLGADINATVTRGWVTRGLGGFKPIDGFTGFLDGCVTDECDGGFYVVRGLFIDRTSDNVGLFSQIIKSNPNELAVSDLGVEEADISGSRKCRNHRRKNRKCEFSESLDDRQSCRIRRQSWRFGWQL